jgi:hypothetical protein
MCKAEKPSSLGMSINPGNFSISSLAALYNQKQKEH